MYSLTFKTRHRFDDKKSGITIPVLLQTSTERVDLLAKIDTGADYCLFQRDYAELLGIDVERGDKRVFGTVAGNFMAFGHELTIHVFGQPFFSTVYFYANTDCRRDVLGRSGFLNQVRLALVEHDSEVYCSAYDDAE